MRRPGRKLAGIALCWVAIVASADPDECLACHAVEDFEGLSIAEILEALRDPRLPPHRKFAEWTEAEVTAQLRSE